MGARTPVMESDPLESCPRLDRTAFSVARDFDDAEERGYWHRHTPEERLAHMELLRRINYGTAATARLQRVLEIAQR